jgi:predicted phage tail protein
VEEQMTVHSDGPDHISQAESRTVVDRKTWSPSQIVAGVIGLFLTVLGAVAILRAGFDSLTGETAAVLGFEHTLLMGIIHLVAGLFFLGAAGTALGSRSGLTTLGLIALAFVSAIEPESLAAPLGGDERIGWLYAVVGAVALLSAWVSPTIHTQRTATARTVDSVRDSAVPPDDPIIR